MPSLNLSHKYLDYRIQHNWCISARGKEINRSRKYIFPRIVYSLHSTHRLRHSRAYATKKRRGMIRPLRRSAFFSKTVATKLLFFLSSNWIPSTLHLGNWFRLLLCTHPVEIVMPYTNYVYSPFSTRNYIQYTAYCRCIFLYSRDLVFVVRRSAMTFHV